MHDSKFEDRLRTVLHAEGDGLPMTITAAELERRLAGRQRQDHGRRLAAIAAVIAFVAVGAVAAMSNGWLRLPAVGTTPSPSPTGTPAATGTEPPPSGLPCTTIDPRPITSAISIVIETAPGDSIAYVGAASAYRIGGTTHGTPGRFADANPGADPVAVDGSPNLLQVSAAMFDACIVALEADAVPIDRLDAAPIPLSPVRGSPTPVATFSAPPVGSWILRVRATFATTVDDAWSEAFFKVDVTGPAFTPPTMGVGASLLGVSGQKRDLMTGCVAFYHLADGTQGTNACSGDWQVPGPSEPLEVGWSGDFTFAFEDGWQFKDTLISSAAVEDVVAGTVGIVSEIARAGETPVASLTVAGWRFAGDNVLRIEGTFVKGTESFTAAYAVVVRGPSKEPAVKGPAVTCAAPDRSASAPPSVRLLADGKRVATGEFGTTSWNGSSSDSPADPVPGDAVTVKAGTPLELRIDGNVCATTWSVRFGPVPTGSDGPPSVQTAGSLVLLHQAPSTGKAARQNRFALADLPRGEWVIIGGFGYDGGDAVVGWRVVVE